MTLEAELIERLLAPLRRHPSVRGDSAMLLALDTMVAEERRHYAGFAAFNRACRPDLYPVGQRPLLRAPALVDAGHVQRRRLAGLASMRSRSGT